MLNNNNRAIKQYKAAATDNNAQLSAIKTINPFWNKLKDSEKDQILAFIGEFKQARSGIMCCSASESAQNKTLSLLQDYLQTKQFLHADLSIDELEIALYSLIKNDNLVIKAKVTDGINALLFHPQAVVNDKQIFGGKQFLIKHAKNDNDFAEKLLNNLKLNDPKPILLFVLANNLSNLPIMTADAQFLVADAIRDGKFGNDGLLLKALAEGVVMFTDWAAQIVLVDAIWLGRFGKTSLVLTALAKSLAGFTCQRAQQDIASAIWLGQFGKTSVVLEELAKNSANFTYPKAQQEIAASVRDGKFGNDALVLLALAKSIAKFTDPEAQQTITAAVRDGKFGNDSLVLLELAKGIAKFTDPKAQQNISEAMWYGKFGQDSVVLAVLAKSIASVTLPIVQQNIQIKSLLSCWILPTQRYQEISAILDTTKSFLHIEKLQFGEFQEYNYAEDTYADIAGINIENCFGCSNNIHGQPTLAVSGYGTHGIIYNKDGAAEFLVTYREDVGENNPEHAIKERFNGFFSPNTNNVALYQNNFANIQIYAINPGLDGYPVLLEKIVSAEKFNLFPYWLQKAIRSQEFDPKQYHSPHLLEFVLAFIDSLPFAQDDIGKTTRDIIISIIKGQGNPFNLSSNHQLDAKIKNEINEAFNAEDNTILYQQKLDVFWNTLSITDDKLKLIFLLGQIAKKGALGYHLGPDDENNTANRAFYKLTEYGLAKLLEEQVGNLPAYLQTMANNLSLGLCIEIESNNLMLAHPQINKIWQKKN